MPEQIRDLKPEKKVCHPTKKWIWKRPIQSVLVVKKCNDRDVIQPFIRVLKYLISQQRKVFIEQQVYEEEDSLQEIKEELNAFSDTSLEIDLILTIGGDGTLLYTASLFQKGPIPPVMAFHAGSLGFLTRFSLENFEEKLQRVFASRATCVNWRSRLLCKIIKNAEEVLDESESADEFHILNDVVVERNHYPFLSNVDLYINDNYVTTLQGDGIIISTPTGSTAYSSSAGASILHPSVQGVVITPICPHSLSFRPVVVPQDCEIKIKIAPESRNSGFISLDGRHRQELKIGDTLVITASEYSVPTLLSNDEIEEWFESLRTCLRWNDRQKQKPFRYN